ncbi:MAG: type II toxin-antitoxin system VapC family toxin [Deltaproteobacteria bacterium]|nr:type II toxin-antitoxin system VapC family toxin [Deltaproteobacteria bacterium]
MLLDSNIIILAALPKHEILRKLIADKNPALSIVSRLEVLGYHALKKAEEKYFEVFFEAAKVLAVSEPVVDRAIHLRKQKNMTLGDALIAATALVYDKTLITHNTKDFKWIKNLKLLDPL